MRVFDRSNFSSLLVVIVSVFAKGVATVTVLLFFNAFAIEVKADEEGAALSATAALLTQVTIEKFDLWKGGTKLRGANIWQHRDYQKYYTDFFNGLPIGPQYTQADFDRLAGMKANYVNISHPGIFAVAAPHQIDNDSRDNLDALLEMIGNANMFAVISFRTGPGRSEFTFVRNELNECESDCWFTADDLDETVWTDQGKQGAWAAMWSYTAKRYKDNPIVVGYDLMVEPNSADILGEYEPDEFYPVPDNSETLEDWNQFFPDLITAIRNQDKQIPILVGGMGYSAIEWLPYIKTIADTRTVLTFHQYKPDVYIYQDSPPFTNTYPGNFDADWDDCDDNVNREWIDTMLTQADNQEHPVAVNEFGVMRWAPGVEEFMTDSMDLFELEQRGWNHALWHFQVSFDDGDDSFHFLLGPDPNNLTEVASSNLITAIKANWSRNTLFPSTVRFKKKVVMPWFLLLLR